jgi:hypothetical protein
VFSVKRRSLEYREYASQPKAHGKSRLAILGRLGRSLGQAPASAKSESDWIHFVTTFATIALLLTAVALLACWIPARRATKVDPMAGLHCD